MGTLGEETCFTASPLNFCMKSSRNLIISLAFLLPGIPAAWAQGDKKPQEIPDRVILTVDGTPIKQSHVEEAYQRQYSQKFAQFPPEQVMAMRQQVLPEIRNELVGKVLLTNAAEKEGLEVTKEEVTSRMEEMAKQLGDGSTVDELVKEVGITRKIFEADVRESLLIQQLIDLKTAEIVNPSDEEVKKFYDQNKKQYPKPRTANARHILIKTDRSMSQKEVTQKLAHAHKILKEIRDTSKPDFAEFAKKYSEGLSAPKGGDLGEFSPGELGVPEFDQAVFTAKPGEITEVVRTKFGFHIIKIDSMEAARSYELEEVRDRITDTLRREKKGNVMRDLIDDLRSKAKIEAPSAE